MRIKDRCKCGARFRFWCNNYSTEIRSGTEAYNEWVAHHADHATASTKETA